MLEEQRRLGKVKQPSQTRNETSHSPQAAPEFLSNVPSVIYSYLGSLQDRRGSLQSSANPGSEKGSIAAEALSWPDGRATAEGKQPKMAGLRRPCADESIWYTGHV